MNEIGADRQNEESCNNRSHRCPATGANLVESDCRSLEPPLSMQDLELQGGYPGDSPSARASFSSRAVAMGRKLGA